MQKNTNELLVTFGYPRGEKLVSLQTAGAAAKWLRKNKQK